MQVFGLFADGAVVIPIDNGRHRLAVGENGQLMGLEAAVCLFDVEAAHIGGGGAVAVHLLISRPVRAVVEAARDAPFADAGGFVEAGPADGAAVSAELVAVIIIAITGTAAAVEINAGHCMGAGVAVGIQRVGQGP